MGLGLPIARRLVESQGGRIRVEEAPTGVGARLVLTLPCAGTPEAGVSAPVSEVASDLGTRAGV